MSSESTGDGGRVAQLERRVAELETQLTDDDRPRTTRRQVLGSIAAGGLLGGVAGAGSAAGAIDSEDTSASLGAIGSGVSKVADPGYYAGPDAQLSTVSPDSGRIYRSDDYGIEYYGTGSSWDVLPQMRTYFAEDFDQVHDLLQNTLPSEGGRIIGIPKRISSVPSQTVTIPGPDDANGGRAYYEVDLSAWQWDLDSTPPDPVFERVDDGTQAGPIRFRGPRCDATDVSNANLGTFARFKDIVKSEIELPLVEGEWDVVEETQALNGSGHQNRHYVNARDMEIGIRVNSPGTGQSDDRSLFYGQLTRIRDTGVEVVDGDKNDFHVQPENEHPDVAADSVTGVHITTGCIANRVELLHGGVGTPLRDEGKATEIAMKAAPANIIHSSLLGGAPWQISDVAAWQSREVDFSLDPLSLYDVSATGSPGLSMAGFGAINIDTSTSNGDTEYIQTRGVSIGGQEGPKIVYAEVELDAQEDRDNGIARIGIYNDANNYVMVAADPAQGPNWQFEVNDGTAGMDRTDTGVRIGGANDSPYNDYVYGITVVRADESASDQQHYCSVSRVDNDDRPIVATSNQSTGAWLAGQGDDMRVEYTPSGAASSRRLQVRALGYGGITSSMEAQ